MTNPDFAKAAAHITAENVRDLLIDLVDIPSATGQEIGGAQYLVGRMCKSGLKTGPTRWDICADAATGSTCCSPATWIPRIQATKSTWRGTASSPRRSSATA